MNIAVAFLLTFLIVCAASVALVKDPLKAVLIQMGFSTVMAVIWLILESPDLAVTEAAVGAGVTGILFFLTMRRIGLIGGGSCPRSHPEVSFPAFRCRKTDNCPKGRPPLREEEAFRQGSHCAV